MLIYLFIYLFIYLLIVRVPIGKDVALAAVGKEEDAEFAIPIKGNYQQCFYPGCQERCTNGAGMKTHLERAHGKEAPPDLGGRDILVAHLKKGEDITLAQVVEEKTAWICTEPNCGFAGSTEQSVRSHMRMQHQGGTDCRRVVIRLYVGNIAQDTVEISPQGEHDKAEEEFLAHKHMTVEERIR
jgi:hypothetical protein